MSDDLIDLRDREIGRAYRVVGRLLKIEKLAKECKRDWSGAPPGELNRIRREALSLARKLQEDTKKLGGMR